MTRKTCKCFRATRFEVWAGERHRRTENRSDEQADAMEYELKDLIIRS